jgi:glutaredoxin-dependent peroxiredoxin
MGLLRDRSDEFRSAGVEPYAISRDSPWTHIAWLQALDLNFPLLSDWNGEATHAFGVAHEFRAFRDVAERSAFIVDRDGVVRFARLYGSGELPDFDELIEAARGL